MTPGRAMRGTEFVVALLVLTLACVATTADAEEGLALVPLPQSIEWRGGAFALNDTTTIAADPNLEPAAHALRQALGPATGFALADGAAATATIRFTLEASLAAEGYRLEASPAQVEIRASTAAGAFYAVQTLRQLLPVEAFSETPVRDVDWRIPAALIEDAPRFGWRGMHLDVGRHFMPVEFVLDFIDALAMHKMNRFHWHLTEDQGWRIEIRRYPKLAEVGAWRAESEGMFLSGEMDGTPHGGFYTQDEIRRVVAYAAERFVTIVPEIEMPGHAQAAIAAYPELGNTGETLPVRARWGVNEHVLNVEESTIVFLQNTLDEVIELFPGPWIHIGGDEAPTDEWEESERAQLRMRALGLEEERELQGYLISRMHAFLRERGRQLVGWDEILDTGTLPEDTVVMSWRGSGPGSRAALEGHPVVMAPIQPTYFDYTQSSRGDEPPAIPVVNRLEDVYAFEPVPADLPPAAARRILGAQGQLWTELMPVPDHVAYMAFPRAIALAEVLWLDPGQRDYDDFRARLEPHLTRFDLLGLPYRPPGDDALTLGDRVIRFAIDSVGWVMTLLP